MKYLLFLRMLISSILSSLVEVRKRANYLFQNPTCRFHRGAVLIDSKLEGMNILFNDTQLISSSLGKHSYVQKRTTIVNAEIGKFCSIASNVSIGPGIHKIDGVTTHPAFFLRNTPLVKTFAENDLYEASKKSFIGHDVWIGEGVIVIDGIKIGTGAIVAAGAVVVKDVEPYSVVGGVPAKHIKYRFDSETITILQDSKWWNFSEEWFENNAKLIINREQFINYLKSAEKDK